MNVVTLDDYREPENTIRSLLLDSGYNPETGIILCALGGKATVISWDSVELDEEWDSDDPKGSYIAQDGRSVYCPIETPSGLEQFFPVIKDFSFYLDYEVEDDES